MSPFLLRPLVAALSALGRMGTQGFVAAIILGLALPQLATLARPLLPVTLFAFLMVMFARADLTAIGAVLRRPWRFIGACLWLQFVPLALMAATIALVGRHSADPGLILGLAVMGAAPPIISSPAIAILYGFEPSLIIAAVVTTTAITPLVAPAAAEVLAGAAVPIDRVVLSLRLAGLIGGGIASGLLLRVFVGRERILSVGQPLDGVVVALFAVFATAAMDGVTAAAFARPGTVAAYLALAFLLSLIGFAVSLLALRFLGPSDRFMLGYGTGQRNMGLIIAAMGAGTPATTYLFFALAQIPIFIMPQVLQPVARRIARAQEREKGKARPASRPDM